MNALLAFLPKPFLFGLVVVLASLLFVQSCSTKGLRKENARYEAAVEKCVTTNKKNRGLLDFYKLQNEQCLEGRREDETKVANAAAAWQAEKNLLLEKAENAEVRNVEVYRAPSCSELAQISITDTCPDLANRLRERAESYNRIRNPDD